MHGQVQDRGKLKKLVSTMIEQVDPNGDEKEYEWAGEVKSHWRGRMAKRMRGQMDASMVLNTSETVGDGDGTGARSDAGDANREVELHGVLLKGEWSVYMCEQ